MKRELGWIGVFVLLFATAWATDKFTHPGERLVCKYEKATP